MTDKEIDEMVERKKMNISDYLRIAETMEIPPEEQEIHIDIMLDDILRLKKRYGEEPED